MVARSGNEGTPSKSRDTLQYSSYNLVNFFRRRRRRRRGARNSNHFPKSKREESRRSKGWQARIENLGEIKKDGRKVERRRSSAAISQRAPTR